MSAGSAGPIIDLRSDTVTLPTAAMRRAMADAEVGDDVFGEDPTVRRLEDRCAERLGHEAAIFLPSGTMANQVAIHVHTRPSDEVIVEATGHSHDWELSGMAVLSGVQPRAIAGDRGLLLPARVAPELAERPWMRAGVGLVIVENTHNMAGGRVLPQATLRELHALCGERGVPVHLDGARLFNAAVASGAPVASLAADCESVMVSLSKGLCAPVGSLLAASAELIREARRVRKMLGGGMRQAGVVAAAGLVALDSMVERLAEDHAKARQLADGLVETGKVTLAFGHVDTNIVVVDVGGSGLTADRFCAAAKEAGVLCIAIGTELVRFVTHRDVGFDDISRAVDALRELLYVSGRPGGSPGSE